ncbi:superoxide dismutase [Mycobacterium sp. 1100029.7]|nr:superoxide dismutase [Mycobacterium sp. 1100029.7]
MNKGVSFAVAALTATIAPLAACANQQGNQAGTSGSSSAAPGSERMTTQLKSADGTQVGNATIDFANGYATVTVEAGPNQVLTPGFHGLMIHAVGKCEPSDFESAGSVYQAPDHNGFPASGDLTALQVRSDGSAKLVTTTNLFTAADLRNSSGSSLVVHQSAADLTGASTSESKRIACGVITAASGSTTTSSTTTTSSVSTVTTTAVVPPPSVSTSTVTVTPTTSSLLTTTATTPPSLPPGTR